MTGCTLPPLFAALCDDAAMFPPGSWPATEAVSTHRWHHGAAHAHLVGPFVVDAGHMGAVAEQARLTATEGPLRVVLVATGAPDGLLRSVQAALSATELQLVGVEVTPDPNTSARKAVLETVAALDAAVPRTIPAAMEIPRGIEPGTVLDILAASRYSAKFRTGGTTSQAFPSEAELARVVTACVNRSLPFKCTAGLHHAVRHTDPETGFEHHGFLNVLAATHVAGRGGDTTSVTEILRERSGHVLTSIARQWTAADAQAVRGAFTSYGTCSIAEPLADLVSLGLLPAACADPVLRETA
ncbi:hypothetical protein HUT19_39865 [Streptomyces sp. NA02950]|uniref:hypothetical protein n=1 Tax=Streptomyces sp. NA02950 TaxID=2742137 RepID=UPI001590E78D|nr:hypothetical protein [Streptomyces sp. NA02950]QKV97083.1 hypothetical protein HUT19_39865 [Streptomyces sp. NA02950]